MSRLFLGGLPTEPDVRRLMEFFSSIHIGEQITHESVASVIGSQPRTSRYRTVTLAWRKRKLDQGIDLAAIPGIGFRALNPSERLDSSVKGIQSGVRKQIRAVNRSDRVVTDDPNLRKKQEVLHRYGIAVRQEHTETMKQLEPPRKSDGMPRVVPMKNLG